MNRKEMSSAWSKIVARAWADEEFKRQLIKNPQEVFKEYGIAQKGVQYKIHENTERETHLLLPPAPAEGMSEEQLRQVAAGLFDSMSTMGTASM